MFPATGDDNLDTGFFATIAGRVFKHPEVTLPETNIAMENGACMKMYFLLNM